MLRDYLGAATSSPYSKVSWVGDSWSRYALSRVLACVLILLSNWIAWVELYWFCYSFSSLISMCYLLGLRGRVSFKFGSLICESLNIRESFFWGVEWSCCMYESSLLPVKMVVNADATYIAGAASSYISSSFSFWALFVTTILLGY